MRTSVEDIFSAVADLPVEARTRYFAEHGIDLSTSAEVRSLLDFDSPESISLDREIGGHAGRVILRFETEETLCGPYRLCRLLGKGGMGTVHLAERADGEVAQQVAIKVLRPGADDPPLRRRFLAERQILATLSHPNIARLLDAGHRHDGQPYLVMEYVAGKRIDAYTDGLGVRRIVALFLKVCAAVGYLHRNLVVHRDLKPSNILVTPEGEPKLLDFGIARMLDLTTESTVTSMRMLTPDYASPEQVAGGPVTTATDIYSLGAVLFKLLTGASPHRFENDSMDAIAFGVCAQQPTPPSRLSPAVGRDLEMIVLKALRKEAHERYTTIEQFCDDLRSYLALGPISARKGDTWYRARKFLQRHWALAGAAALVIASLSTGVYVANRQRAVAERRFAQLRRLSTRVIDLDAAIRGLPGSVEARQRLVAVSLEYLEGLSRDAGRNPDLAKETADGYWRMARIQGVNTEFNLGDHANARKSLEKAGLLIDTVLAAHPHDRNALFRSALIAHDLTNLADIEERRADVIVHTRTAVARLEALLGPNDVADPVRLEGFLQPSEGGQAERARVALMYTNIALACVNAHLYSEGARYARRAVALAQSLPLAAALQPSVQGLSILANALRYQGDLESALASIRQARRIAEEGIWPSQASRFFAVYGALLREGRILGEADAVSANRPAEAIDVLAKALDLAEDAARKDSRDSASRGRVGTSARELGAILRDRDPQRALNVFDLGIRRLAEAGNSLAIRRQRATLLAMSSYPLRRLARPLEATARINTAFTLLNGTGDYPSDRVQTGSHVWVAICALADSESAAGRPRNALRLYEQLLDKTMATGPQPFDDLGDAPQISGLYGALAGLYRSTGDRANAAVMDSRRADLWSHWKLRLPASPFVYRQLKSVQSDLRGEHGDHNSAATR